MTNINVYKRLCDMDGCGNEQCGEPYEGYLECNRDFRITLAVRVWPCRIHLDQLKRIAMPR